MPEWSEETRKKVQHLASLTGESGEACAAALEEIERRPWKLRAADRLADEVAALVTRGTLDSRSAAADALLDYRNPPRTERSDRLAEAEQRIKELKAECDADHPAEPEYTAWCEAGKPDGRRIKELEGRIHAHEEADRIFAETMDESGDPKDADHRALRQRIKKLGEAIRSALDVIPGDYPALLEMRSRLSSVLPSNDKSRVGDYWTIQAMKKWGGSFVQALGEAALRADDDNLRRIKETWPKYWINYAERGEKLRQEAEKKNEA